MAHSLITPILKAQNLSLQLRGKPVLKNVNAQIAAGRWTAIVGPNGAGKSSLARCLAGLIKPSQGQVLFQDKLIQDKPIQNFSAAERAKRISWLGQSALPQLDITVRDLILLGRLPWQNWLAKSSALDEAALQRVLSELQIQDLQFQRSSEISGGELQRVLIARSLVGNADIFVQDEPLANLDIQHQLRWARLMRALVAEGKTVISVLHELPIAMMADDLLLIHQGELVHAGSTAIDTTLQSLSQVFGEEVKHFLPELGRARGS